MKARYAWFLITVLAVSPGCVMIHNFTIDARNRTAACISWWGAKWRYTEAGVPWFAKRHIGVGYRQGYVDVAFGGQGNVPLVPPDCYWGIWFHHPRGYEQVNSYFAGYQDGARAAHAEGISRWHCVPTSRYPIPAPAIPFEMLEGERPEGIPPGVPYEGIPMEAEQLFEQPRPVQLSEPPTTGIQRPGSAIPPYTGPLAAGQSATIR